MDSCIYLKVSGIKFIFLILYVDDVLIASNDLGLLMNAKRMLSQNFDMKDLGEANFVLGIEIHRDRDHKFLGLSQKSYVDCVLERFGMKGCKSGLAPIFKGDRLNKDQYSKNDVEKAAVKDIPYSSIVGSLGDFLRVGFVVFSLQPPYSDTPCVYEIPKNSIILHSKTF